eukprot:210380-Prorocentrum_minimum.AAC.6
MVLPSGERKKTSRRSVTSDAFKASRATQPTESTRLKSKRPDSAPTRISANKEENLVVRHKKSLPLTSNHRTVRSCKRCFPLWSSRSNVYCLVESYVHVCASGAWHLGKPPREEPNKEYARKCGGPAIDRTFHCQQHSGIIRMTAVQVTVMTLSSA